MSPFSRTYETIYDNDRINWMMNHETAHVVNMDQAAGRDKFFRSIFLGKVFPDPEQPLSAIYAYLTTPRRYAPRSYHEGSAVFMETWMSGGLGRTFSAYYEMVFRTMVRDKDQFFDVVGLESEGTTIDFQVGANSYLYGTRFMSYLGNRYGPDNLIQWLARTEDSVPSFSRQFKKVYGLTLDDAWLQWIQWEHQFQQANLERLRAYPTSAYRKITQQPLGSVSRSYYDAKQRRLYVAVSTIGEIPHIAAIDIDTGARRKLAEVHGAGLYYVTSLAYDPATGTLFYTTNNTGWRHLMAVDIQSGKTKRLMKNARVGDLVFNRQDRSLWGTRHDLGLITLVRIPFPYQEWVQILTYDYRYDLYDIDISPDGKWLILIKMSIEHLRQGNRGHTVIFDFENSSPANFKFSPDGHFIFGSSYYSGVSNIYRYDIERDDMSIISNCETGCFRPTPISEDTVAVMRYTNQGFVPVMMANQALENVNAIKFLGNDIIANHPILKTWKAPPPSAVDLDSRITHTGTYDVIKHLRLTSAYPILESYKDTASVGLRLNFADPSLFSALKLSGSYSPDDNLPLDERFHLRVGFRYRSWQIQGWYNRADFYDFFGPIQISRKGYGLAVAYEKALKFEKTGTHIQALTYSIEIAGYAGLETSPIFQDIASTFSEALSLTGTLISHNLVTPLGALEPMQGVTWELIAIDFQEMFRETFMPL